MANTPRRVAAERKGYAGYYMRQAAYKSQLKKKTKTLGTGQRPFGGAATAQTRTLRNRALAAAATNKVNIPSNVFINRNIAKAFQNTPHPAKPKQQTATTQKRTKKMRKR